MKIALLNPRVNDVPHHPLGLLYIASVLEKAAFNVKVFDPLPIEEKKLFEEFLKFKPKVVGITGLTPQILKALEMAEKIKKAIPGVIIVFGGVHPTIFPREIIADKSVDYVVVGEGEKTMLELCEAIRKKKKFPYKQVKGLYYKNGKKIKTTGKRELIKNLDEIPFPARHLLNSDWYYIPPRIRGIWTKRTATVMASRGCPYQCIFCSSHLLFGRNVRTRSVDDVINEIKHLIKDIKIDSLWFADDTFTVNHQWVKEFCEALKKENLNIVWGCQARVNVVTEPILRLLKEAGCVQVDYGVESGSQKVLDILKKGITIKEIKEAFKITKKVGMNRFASIIIGTPGETKEDILKTEKLLEEIKPDFTEIFFATPYPATDLYKLAQEKKLIDPQMAYDTWFSSKQADKPVLRGVEMNREEIAQERNRLHNKIIFNNYLTMLKNKGVLLGILKITWKAGFSGIYKGFARFLKTGKIDNIAVEILVNYRYKVKTKSTL